MQCLVLPKLEGGGGSVDVIAGIPLGYRGTFNSSVSMARASGDVHRVVHKTAPRARFDVHKSSVVVRS